MLLPHTASDSGARKTPASAAPRIFQQSRRIYSRSCDFQTGVQPAVLSYRRKRTAFQDCDEDSAAEPMEV